MSENYFYTGKPDYLTDEGPEDFENTYSFTYTEPDGMRLDAAVSAYGEITRSAAENLIEAGNVSVNGRSDVKKSLKLKTGDTVTVTEPKAVECSASPQDIPIEIVYEDDDIAVVNKPRGMVVHPAPGNPDGTLVNALMYKMQGRLSTINGVIRPGIVHRIDKDTSGLLIVAKNDESHVFLAEKIKNHDFMRVYNGIVTGTFKEVSGRI
ncbi:MAG: RluA family pseudouridine synthase, partial [Clostridiales bacterium]|nr:RluA family pseudouridine synthase [Clostridiales bacterium]